MGEIGEIAEGRLKSLKNLFRRPFVFSFSLSMLCSRPRMKSIFSVAAG
ncbi:hypothetical protein NEIELOOT_01850 [Neisseria elongata subsp. glycolytica ATCC 29315]|uniref:Uncharacterized protein n=1 Tax=Neisseria elongata subsp. glycolytica ATCC 29315 TaxID=546263 RepID=D4DS07_NEIEG|nr:hypothetical protein NEIELOOT_01850 [Neisseria elongata subsp. glycolytica ATCC 29315]